MYPETHAEFRIGNWLTQHNIQYWHNRKITELKNDNIFRVEGTQKKPDMIIQTTKIPISGFIAIEIKPGQLSKAVRDSCKTLTYLRNYTNGLTKYFIGNKEIKIKVFAIATQFSIEGKLFNEQTPMSPTDLHWSKILKKTKNEPPIEFIKTKEFVRNLWANWRLERTNNDPGIGIITSGILNKNDDTRPWIQYQLRYAPKRQQKSRWNVRWNPI
jgi:hypothetical protein